MVRTLLIDGDIFIYQIASALEQSINWGDGIWTLHADEKEGQRRLLAYLNQLGETLEADKLVVAIKDDENWRRKILPTYKANRQNMREPLIRRALMDFVAEKFKVYQKPTLEGDDVLGILATAKAISGEKIIVSIDKDMKSIPGKSYNPDHPDLGIVDTTEAQADHFHMFQTLVGDRTDNYGGCPGVGPVKAQVILAEAGLDSGKTYWDCVALAYKVVGLSEEVALTMARVARICRASDYDFKRKEVILWTPTPGKEVE